MPNHVQNRITLEGDESAIQRMLAQIQNDEFGTGTIDFNKIIPMPDRIYRGDLSPKEMRLYGENNWYNWSVANWGTKWNAYGYVKGTDYSQEKELTFQTAWSAPHAVLEKLSEQFPEVEITHEWANEDIGMNCGRRMYSGGERCEEYVPESEKEAVEFAEGIWGFSGDDFQESEALVMA